MEKKFSQQHETMKITEDGVIKFIKFYRPNSPEIKNEISWLTSILLANLDTFKVPKIIESSLREGFVKMDYIEESSEKIPTKLEVVEYLTRCASELHRIVETKEPITRVPTSSDRYSNYVEEFVKNRLQTIRTELPIEKEIEDWILIKVKNLKTKVFGIVHRDLRFRHLLWTEQKPALIDWEYSNISDPAQDLAKLVYDSVINHEVEKNLSQKIVVENYAYLQGLTRDEVLERISIFLPIIPLEHCAAFIKRKPNGYQSEVARDLAFIYALYNEEN